MTIFTVLLIITIAILLAAIFKKDLALTRAKINYNTLKTSLDVITSNTRDVKFENGILRADLEDTKKSLTSLCDSNRVLQYAYDNKLSIDETISLFNKNKRKAELDAKVRKHRSHVITERENNKDNESLTANTPHHYANHYNDYGLYSSDGCSDNTSKSSSSSYNSSCNSSDSSYSSSSSSDSSSSSSSSSD